MHKKGIKILPTYIGNPSNIDNKTERTDNN